MSKPLPPCDPKCPRRSMVCHDRAVCPDWGPYQDALAAWHKMILDAKRPEYDYNDARRVDPEERQRRRNR